MKRFVLIGLLLLAVCICATYYVFARHGGESFIGGFGGSMMGSVVGSAITSKSSGRGDSSGKYALERVDRLESIMRSDLTKLNDRIDGIEKDVKEQSGEGGTEAIEDLQASLKQANSKIRNLEQELNTKSEEWNSKIDVLEKRLKKLEQEQGEKRAE